MALRGQANAPEELLRFRYRERFKLSEEQLQNEPQDVYNLNLSIMQKEWEVSDDVARHRNNQEERNSRPK